MPTLATVPAVVSPEVAGAEAAHNLHGIAHKKTGRIPPDILVRHVLRVYRTAEWPVQRAAMEAILRRIAFAERDRLAVGTRPRGGAAFGLYTTRRRQGTARDWHTRLDALEPVLRASCDCPDFLRGSLGVCKHVLAVLEALAAKKGAFEKLLTQRASAASAARVEWDPIRPLLGAGDCLERVRLLSAPARDMIVRRWFQADARGDHRLSQTCIADRGLRLDAVRAIRRWIDRSRIAADPSILRLLGEEEARLTLAERCHATSDDALKSLRRLKHELRPFQREGVERFLAEGRLLLADDMGLGKTVQAIAACHALWSVGAVKRGLVVVPASLKPQWLREWHAWTDAPVVLLDGSPDERARVWRNRRSGFLLVNYEQVIRDHGQVLSWRPDLAILDEAQRIKNWETKSAACVKALTPDWRLVLTGTPMENRLEELASILDWIDDRALEPKWRLVPFHSIAGDGLRQSVGSRHLDVLRERLAPCMLRRVRKEVLKQLPSRTNTLVPVEITPEQKEEHDALTLPIIALMKTAERRPLTRAEFLHLMQLLNTQRMIANALAQVHFEQMWPALEAVPRPNAVLLASLSSPKLLQLRDMLTALVVDQERKVVVFSQWRRMLLLADWSVRDILADNGLRAVFFTGQESQKRRTHNLVDFHDDPKTRVLFASDAGGVGLNLQRAASAIINLELPWNPAVLEQRVGRIHRMGQKLPIDVINLVAQGCIEQRIANLVSDKQALFRELFDGVSDEVQFQGSASFMAGLQRVTKTDAEAPTNTQDLATDDGGSVDSSRPGERALDELLERADEADGAPLPSASNSVPAASADSRNSSMLPEGARELFERVTLTRAKDGSVSIHAPPQAAASLARLFSQFAELLESAARP